MAELNDKVFRIFRELISTNSDIYISFPFANLLKTREIINGMKFKLKIG